MTETFAQILIHHVQKLTSQDLSWVPIAVENFEVANFLPLGEYVDCPGHFLGHGFHIPMNKIAILTICANDPFQERDTIVNKKNNGTHILDVLELQFLDGVYSSFHIWWWNQIEIWLGQFLFFMIMNNFVQINLRQQGIWDFFAFIQH